MTMTAEKFEFQTEARQLLDLMVHAIYSNKDIFLRELISNASDALDKRRYESVRQPELLPEGTVLAIRVDTDAEARTLTVSDNGIGMSRDELIALIGTIAKSGTKEFARRLREAQGGEVSADLIGQFGVGFYSVFMVADRVTMVTRRAGEEGATRWESTGDGTYTLEPAERDEPGTTITLHLKQAEGEDDTFADYTSEWKLRGIIKQYSDFVAYPIQMEVSRKGEDGQDETRLETVNSMKAIWLRDKGEVTDAEFNEFYKHIAHDWQDPLSRIQAKIEGKLEYRLLLFVPSAPPFDLYMRDARRHGVHLYVKRVFIMDDCRELMPEYLRFMRGVVDSEDLSLNISREILQQDKQIERMRKGIVSKVLAHLKEMKDKEPEKYLQFWKQFGRVLKEGLFQDYENRDALLDLCLFQSTMDPSELTSLQAYVDRMKADQEEIYFMTGASRKKIESSPHLEAFVEKGYEVLLLEDPVDEVWTDSVHEFKGKRFQSAGKGAVDLGSEEEKKKAEEKRKEQTETYGSLLECLKKHLEEYVKEVRLSSRLRNSAACLVTDAGDVSPQLEMIMRAAGQEMPPIKRILEVNSDHEILRKLNTLYEQNQNDPAIADYAQLLYGQAVLAEGGQLPDPGAFARQVAALMARAMQA